ncbi:MAG: hypothetical protein HDR21_08880 [Lachnospiraceae bacterium]|nr:hypothetical protein [Lachnospiraceae bacterium]
MRECWENLLTFLGMETRSGAYWALALAAVLYLAGTRVVARKACVNAENDGSAGDDAPAKEPGNKTWRKLIVLFVWLLIFMNPLTAVLFEKVFGNFYRYVYAALTVPVLPVIAYAAADIWENQERHAALVALFLAAAIALAGTVFPFDEAGGGTGRRSAQWDDAERGAFDVILSEAERLKEDGQTALLVAPMSMMEMVRRYDADILLAYGRDLWQTNALFYVRDGYGEEQVRLCLSMEAEPFQAEQAAELALAYGCNLIVLKEPLGVSFSDNRGLSCVYESESVFVYVR